MRSMEPLHRVTIGRTREVRGPDAFERGAVGVIIAVAVGFAVWFGVNQMRMAEAVGAMTLARGVVTNEIVYRAVHGVWPAPGNRATVAGNDKGVYVTSARLGEGGVITMHMTLGPRSWHALLNGEGPRKDVTGDVSFRPQLLGAPGYQSVTLLCGYAKPVGQSSLRGATNKTTLDRADLPPVCR